MDSGRVDDGQTNSVLFHLSELISSINNLADGDGETINHDHDPDGSQRPTVPPLQGAGPLPLLLRTERGAMATTICLVDARLPLPTGNTKRVGAR